MSESAILSHTFPNGLTLVAEPMKNVQSAAFTMLVPAGIVYESLPQAGLAAMLAEWTLRGAGDRDSRAVVAALDHLGVSYSQNASLFHTGVSAVTLGKNLFAALEIFADVLRRPQFDDDEIEPIRELAVQGLQSLEDEPSALVMRELRRCYWPDPHGRHSQGTLEGVSAVTSDDLRSFFSQNYQAQGAILGVAGAVDWPALLDAVGRLWGDWDGHEPPVVRETPRGPRDSHILRETNQTQVAMAFDSVPVNDPRYYLARAAVGILGGSASSRLFAEVREKRGLCYSVSAGYEGLRDRAAILCYAGTSADRAQETLDVMYAELERLRKSGVEQEELDIMRAGLKTSLIMQQESSMSRSGSLTADWYHLGRVRSLDELSRALDALTPEAVSAYVRDFPPGELTIVTLGPAPLGLPRLA